MLKQPWWVSDCMPVDQCVLRKQKEHHAADCFETTQTCGSQTNRDGAQTSLTCRLESRERVQNEAATVFLGDVDTFLFGAACDLQNSRDPPPILNLLLRPPSPIKSSTPLTPPEISTNAGSSLLQEPMQRSANPMTNSHLLSLAACPALTFHSALRRRCDGVESRRRRAGDVISGKVSARREPKPQEPGLGMSP
ncbi:hypothetical protein VTI74DRAFT_2882 [Chaetomium olivicolor]